jgi:hypothetical protein
MNPFYINSYGQNCFGLRTFWFINGLQERIKLVNLGLIVVTLQIRQALRDVQGVMYILHTLHNRSLVNLVSTLACFRTVSRVLSLRLSSSSSILSSRRTAVPL